jgi:hypothetical protein
LHGNYPNPFSTTTELSFDLPAVAEVSIEVYDTMGRRVFNTAPKLQPAGMKQRIQIDAQGLSSGMYLYRLRADTATRSYTGSGRLVLVK